MPSDQTLVDLIRQYESHGWQPRRILTTVPDPDNRFQDVLHRHPDIFIETSELDAIWFTRRSFRGKESWELRRISGTPFALVEVLDDSESDEVSEHRLRLLEKRMSGSL